LNGSDDEDDDDLSDEPEVNSSNIYNAVIDRDSMVLMGDNVLKGIKRKKDH